jgi:type I restriction enzyme S subunit
MLENAQGQTRAGLNSAILKAIPVPVCPLAEQVEIVSRMSTQLSHIDATIAEIDEQIERSTFLRQSILRKAFSGQLVPQDPNDEPASVLLERIKAEKERSAVTKQKPKKLKAQGAAA